MNWPATIANSLWVGSSLPAWNACRRALHRPAETQWNLLRNLLARNAGCAYGRAHGFEKVRSYADFTRSVPLVDYEILAPWVERIRAGEHNVLTSGRVTHLIPTSGSTGARKLIPFTAELQSQFNRAIGPWITGLALEHPEILAGPAYWSITPPKKTMAAESSAVPVGFADDASYLGGIKGRLIRAAMVVPGYLSDSDDIETFRFQTLLCLLRERELRLISVWHPSFLAFLLDALPVHWDKILSQLRRERRGRALELERANPGEPHTLWPRLRVISCWGDNHANLAMTELQRRFPQMFVQAKGLLATEAFVTIPFAGSHPLAIGSHFFEFLDSRGQVRLAHELSPNETYEVVVTTAGGLWRYRMRDQVRVNGFAGKTPSLQFIGRAGNVCDLFGEKLSEAFVADAVQQTLFTLGARPRFMLLAPDQDAAGWRYTLYVEGAVPADAAAALDHALRQNPGYSHCRDIANYIDIYTVCGRSWG